MSAFHRSAFQLHRMLAVDGSQRQYLFGWTCSATKLAALCLHSLAAHAFEGRKWCFFRLIDLPLFECLVQMNLLRDCRAVWADRIVNQRASRRPQHCTHRIALDEGTMGRPCSPLWKSSVQRESDYRWEKWTAFERSVLEAILQCLTNRRNCINVN